MPTYFIIEGVKIDLYFNDHSPPHFHAKIAEYEELITIETLETLRGKLPSNKRKSVIKWARENNEMIIDIWDKLREV